MFRITRIQPTKSEVTDDSKRDPWGPSNARILTTTRRANALVPYDSHLPRWNPKSPRARTFSAEIAVQVVSFFMS